MDKEKINYCFNFNCARVCEKLFIYRNFSDTKVIILYSKIGPLCLAPEGVLSYKDVGSLAPKFASEIHVGAPNFASKNIDDKYPKLCSLNFRYNPKCPPNCDSFPIFASCSNRTNQFFPLIW